MNIGFFLLGLIMGFAAGYLIREKKAERDAAEASAPKPAASDETPAE